MSIRINADIIKTEGCTRKIVRGYQLHNGDVFTVPSKRWFEVFSKSNSHHIFVPLRVYRKVVWHRPSTWFGKWCDIQYIEMEG